MLHVVCCMLYVGLPVESGRLCREGSLGPNCPSGLLRPCQCDAVHYALADGPLVEPDYSSVQKKKKKKAFYSDDESGSDSDADSESSDSDAEVRRPSTLHQRQCQQRRSPMPTCSHCGRHSPRWDRTLSEHCAASSAVLREIEPTALAQTD